MPEPDQIDKNCGIGGLTRSWGFCWLKSDKRFFLFQRICFSWGRVFNSPHPPDCSFWFSLDPDSDLLVFNSTNLIYFKFNSTSEVFSSTKVRSHWPQATQLQQHWRLVFSGDSFHVKRKYITTWSGMPGSLEFKSLHHFFLLYGTCLSIKSQQPRALIKRSEISASIRRLPAKILLPLQM